jgi:hypothetical protein
MLVFVRALMLLALWVSLAGCNGERPIIVGIPVCGSDVILCGETQTRNGLRCASCTDANDTLSCQTAEHERVVCVSDCSSCDHEPQMVQAQSPATLLDEGIHVCGWEDDNGGFYQRNRDHAMCATCFTLDLSMTAQVCGPDYCTNVVCVQNCEACGYGE